MTSDQEAPEDRAADGPGITDEQLPEDLQPGEDNPLAEPLPDGESADLGIPEPGEPTDRDEATGREQPTGPEVDATEGRSTTGSASSDDDAAD